MSELTDDELLETVALLKQHGSQTAVSAITGISRSAIQNRLSKAVAKGLASSVDIVSTSERISDASIRLARKRDTALASVLNAGDKTSPADPIELRRLRNEIGRLRGEIRDLTSHAINDQALRAAVFQLKDIPAEPISFQATKRFAKAKAETIVINISDVHWGEVVDLDAMDGVNSYNVPIAKRRLKNAFVGAADLATDHWAGPPPARLIVVLGGDMISGEIHNELERTNEAKSLPAAKDCAWHIAAGLELLAARLPGIPIEVIVIPGNHGRSTLKYQSKGYALTSYDTLVGDLVETRFHGQKRFSFYRPASGDALFNVYNWLVLATHGDRIGSRGGQGFVGVAATAARGFKKLIMDYAARGYRLDLILCDHFHTALELEEGYVNSALVGPSEYSRDGRFRPRPATQLFLSIHPDRGVTQMRRLQVGAPSEGSLYATPALQSLEHRRPAQ